MNTEPTCPAYADDTNCGLKITQEALSHGLAFVQPDGTVLMLDVPLIDDVHMKDVVVGLRNKNQEPTLWPTGYLGCLSCSHCIIVTAELGEQFARRSVEPYHIGPDT
jgi:hypothetical protein